MALVPVHQFFIYKGKLKAVSEFVPAENDGGIYEVLRVENGVPLFFEEHMQRFQSSAKIAQLNIPFTTHEILDQLYLLIEKNDVSNGNLLVSLKTNFKAFFIAHKYPGAVAYKVGVNCGVLHAERLNPNAKVFQTSVREKANALIENNQFYEVLLVDQDNYIREGSRSNVFFVKNQSLYTPKSNKVLLGITRQKVIECAHSLGIEVHEKNIGVDDLNSYDALFLTGTSPKVLPIKKVGIHNFNVKNEWVEQIISTYNLLVQQYVEQKQHRK